MTTETAPIPEWWYLGPAARAEPHGKVKTQPRETCRVCNQPKTEHTADELAAGCKREVTA